MTTGLKRRSAPRWKKQTHMLAFMRGGVVVEIALGKFGENDIVRIEDDYGRV
jgi:hypothetical protein